MKLTGIVHPGDAGRGRDFDTTKLARRFIGCSQRCRLFKGESVKDVGAWIMENLDAEVRPNAEMVWGKKVTWEGRP